MPDQPTPDRLTSLLFNAITRALPTDRFVALSERMAVAEAVRQVVEEQLGVSAMWEAGHAAGVAEGRRLRAEQLDLATRGAYKDGKGDGRAEGRRQATEGWEREWGVIFEPDWYPDPDDPSRHHPISRDDESHADWIVDQHSDRPRRKVSRLVGPWEAAEQTQDGAR